MIAAVVVGGAADHRRPRHARRHADRRRPARHDRPGPGLPRRRGPVGEGDPGGDHPAGRRLGRALSRRGVGSMTSPLDSSGTVSRRRRRLEPAQRILLALLVAGGRGLRRHRHELPHARQRLRGRPAERRARPARPRADAGDRHRRHRPVGRLADGPVGRPVRHALARRGLPIAAGGGCDARRRRAGRRPQRPADHAAAASRR